MAQLLIVEDDDDIRELLSELLGAVGHDVCSARDGVEALELLRQMTPELVLLDVEMPRLDGPSVVLQMAQNDHGWDKIPVILLSGAADLRVTARRVGTPYFIAKPTDLDGLTRTVEEALRERIAPRPQALVSS
jgi:CheY-like chemotaxis protein